MSGLSDASGIYLWLRDPRLDLCAESAAAAGLVFSVVMLTTGPLLGKPFWGTWWTWDARLTFTLFLFFLFLGYRALRGALHDPGERARWEDRGFSQGGSLMTRSVAARKAPARQVRS